MLVKLIRSIVLLMVAIGGRSYQNVSTRENRYGSANFVISSSEKAIIRLPLYFWIGFDAIDRADEG